MKHKKIVLPKIYNNEGGNYPQFVGRPKISYSQSTSYVSDSYLGDYIAGYFMNLNTGTNDFAEYGSAVGTYLEFKGQNKIEELKELVRRGNLNKDSEGKPFEKVEDKIVVYKRGEYEVDHFKWLSENDLNILNNIELPQTSAYEFEIVIDLLPITGVDVVMQGFIDRLTYNKDKSVDVIDYKTGNIKTKVDYYSSEQYYQTRIYAYAMEQLGFTLNYCGVELLSRKGNGMKKYPLKLEDKIEKINTPYNKVQVELKLKEIAKTAVEISDMYAVYNKFFKK